MTMIDRARVQWRDWVWIAWRQQSKSIIGMAVVTTIAFLVIGPLADRTSLNLASVLNGIWVFVPTALSVLIALFWAAPMIAREYEDRTVVFSWTQDVRSWQWVVGRAVPPLVIGVVLIAVLNFQLRAGLDPARFTSGLYEANPYLHTTYVVFGFVLGLVFSAWLRQTPGAIGATVVAFLGFRILVATVFRPYLVGPEGGTSTSAAPSGAYIVDSGYIDSVTGGHASVPSMFTQQCAGIGDDRLEDYCLRDLGISGYYTKYHSISAMWKMQILEGLIYVVCTGLLVLCLWKILDRRQRI
jgi:ABC-type transport system involved in multi-copper enzyme maturation permease subunit